MNICIAAGFQLLYIYKIVLIIDFKEVIFTDSCHGQYQCTAKPTLTMLGSLHSGLNLYRGGL